LKAFNEVKKEFQDFAIDEEGHKQADIVLRCHHGMNFQDFGNLLESVAQRRKEGYLKIHSSSPCACDGRELCADQFHRDFDLNIALDMIQRLKDY
jgi:hypothetical protein